MSNIRIMKRLTIIALAVLASGTMFGQVGSDPTPQSIWYGGECDEYRWPNTPSSCPEVIIKQKGDHHWEKAGDHTTQRRYRLQGWDTVVDCRNREIILSCTPNIPAQRFNGTYYVDEIPYDPADPTFHAGTRMPISTDDNFSNMETNIPYPFYFFGIRKNKFVLGANGLVAFGPVPVTNTTSTGPSCPWQYSAPLPWPDGTSNAPSSLNYMRDAIYGVYEDTYPSPSTHGTTGDPNWGIYYGVQDEWPCRKIICSWNDVPQYSCTSLRCTYQIVCYEGSNIIEVHVNQRQVCSSWNSGSGLIGIQNATGTAQQANSNPQATNGHPDITGKPSSFAPSGYNLTTSNISNKAFRFTPAGSTSTLYGWYRIRETYDTLGCRETRVDTICTAYRYDTTQTVNTIDTTRTTINHIDTTLTTISIDTIWTDDTHTTINRIDTSWNFIVDTTWNFTVDTTWNLIVDSTCTSFILDTVCVRYNLATRMVNDTLRNSEMEWDAQYDEAGYMEPMHENDDDWPCKFLTKAHVSPKVPTRYVFFLKFYNANRDLYELSDTIFVGVDTLDYLNLHKAPATDNQPSKLDICIGDTARMRVDMNKLQSITYEEWTLFRVSGGDTISLDTLVGHGEPVLQNNYLKIDNYRLVPLYRFQGNDTIELEPAMYKKEDIIRVGDTANTRSLVLYSNLLPNRGLKANKVDTLILQVTADYESGCHSFDTMMIRIFPLFDTTTKAVICKGEEYIWSANGETYQTNTNPSITFVRLQSQAQCDSITRLDLTVNEVYHIPDPIEDCKPVTWLNGKTYTESTPYNNTDTITLKNRYNCDSIIHLDLTIYPLTAKLQSDIRYFTIDNLNAVLTDLSINGDSRVWKFPSGPDQTSEIAYYTIPVEMDGADITLIESSRFGCVDTTNIYIPLNKEYFWVPNAFTPDNPAGNNLFGSVSEKTLYQEMFIYNRRGEMVFHCEGADCKWDGKDMNGKPCTQGAYVYLIRYTNEFEPGETRVLKGTVTLIR